MNYRSLVMIFIRNKNNAERQSRELLAWNFRRQLCPVRHFRLIVPESFHNHQFLEAVLPAFKWLTFGGFCLGLIESFLYGVYAGVVFVPIYNFLSRKWGAAAGTNTINN